MVHQDREGPVGLGVKQPEVRAQRGQIGCAARSAMLISSWWRIPRSPLSRSTGIPRAGAPQCAPAATACLLRWSPRSAATTGSCVPTARDAGRPPGRHGDVHPPRTPHSAGASRVGKSTAQNGRTRRRTRRSSSRQLLPGDRARVLDQQGAGYEHDGFVIGHPTELSEGVGSVSWPSCTTTSSGCGAQSKTLRAREVRLGRGRWLLACTADGYAPSTPPAAPPDRRRTRSTS